VQAAYNMFAHRVNEKQGEIIKRIFLMQALVFHGIIVPALAGLTYTEYHY
jgi:hypothetical protein